MTNTAQDALKVFNEERKSISLELITIEYLLQKEKLQIAAEQEIEANRLNAEVEYMAQAEQNKANMIEHLKSIGFSCDLSLEDYKKLFNRPDVFGENWETKANFYHSQGASVDDFLNLTREYLQ